MGMLDLLAFGLPAQASPLLAWLQEQAALRCRQWLLRHRCGEEDAMVPPDAALRELLEGLPPVYGGTVDVSLLRSWFEGLRPALHRTAARRCCTEEEWLSRLGEGWAQLGSLCFHLAENGGEQAEQAPFAFLATFIHRAGQDGKPRHAPLGLARQLYAQDASALLSLLRPLHRAAEQHAFLQELINSGAVYRPCAWTPRQAYAFLETMPLLEQVGIETRMVNLWKKLPPKAEPELRLEPAEGGSKADGAPGLHVRSLLQFSPRVVLGDRALTEEELEELLNRGDDGLVRFCGEWVRVDREKLVRLLNSWRQASRMAAGGIPLLVGLRWLLSKQTPPALKQLPPMEEGVRVTASATLEEALQRLCLREEQPQLPPALSRMLRPYQAEGVRFLLSVTEAGFGACLADDMGLGKTLQVIAWLTHLQVAGALREKAALIVAPASLLTNWQQELEKFAPHLRVRLLHPEVLRGRQAVYLQHNPAELLRGGTEVALTTYGMLTRMADALAAEELPAVVLDEAQAIKNADSARSRAVLSLAARRRVALTGTPVENSPDELRTLFEFLNPGLMGTVQEYRAMVRRMGNDYAPLRRLVRPFLLRRLKSDPALLPELPPKTEQPAYCYLTPEQAALYRREVEQLRAVVAEPDSKTRLMLVLPILSRLKQICNHPEQYRGGQYMDPALSGKMERLGHLCRRMAEAGEACLVFTQYRRMMEPLHDYLAGIFGRPGLMLHGGTPLEERQELVQHFQQPGGPPFFILSLRAAGTGLTLTRASHVIHYDRWWNPAVENQASDRAYRIGQQRAVFIHPLICCGTLEENIHRMLTRKRDMADALLSGGLEKALLNLSPEEWMELAGMG